nr:MAG TPA: hypothetical protein [Caudoviricetes sp.]
MLRVLLYNNTLFSNFLALVYYLKISLNEVI